VQWLSFHFQQGKAVMDSQSFTLFHVVISLVAIASGLVVMYGLLTANRMRAMTALFLVTTIATSATGYFFHRDHILPSHVVGAISLVLLAAACVALYGAHLRGRWRPVYVVSAVVALYLNVFVLVPQGAFVARAGAEGIRTAVRGRAGLGTAGIRRPRGARGQAIQAGRGLKGGETS
jgi:hypothetical protein